VSKAWAPDNGDGTYKNPVLHADDSDPDVVRNGKDFCMVASSFNSVPGLPAWLAGAA
jgi:beta-xylosidase